MKYHHDRLGARIASSLLLSICVVAFSGRTVLADGPRPTVNGKLTTVDGVKVLRIWGDPAERGFAHGYLLADEIIELFEDFLADERLSGGPEGFTAMSAKFRELMKIPKPYLAELRGIKAGLEAKKGGDITITALDRELTLRDLVAMNCIPDSIGIACSSFAAWGDLTPDRKTLSGRNLDWHEAKFLRTTQIIVAHIPAKGAPQNAWTSITWPGMIICLTGMNEHGVTVSMHDVFDTRPSQRNGFTPRGFCLRAAIEGADAGNVIDSVKAILKKHVPIVGNNVPVSFPCENNTASAVVFEYDGNKKRSRGVTVRRPHFKRDDKPRFIVATNDYHKRGSYSHCRRFETLLQTLETMGSSATGIEKKKVEAGFKMLGSVSMKSGYVTYHSVVFEPNDRRLSVSFSSPTDYAPNDNRVTIDLKKVLRRPTGQRQRGANG